MAPHPMKASPPIALIACEVFKSEIELLAGSADHIVVQRMFEIGLTKSF